LWFWAVARHQELAAPSLATKKRIDAASDVGLLRCRRHLGFVPAATVVGWEVVSCFLSCSIAPPPAGRPFDFGVASTSIHLSNRSIVVSCIDHLYTSKLRTWEILDGRLQADGYLLLLLDGQQPADA
jgi:hypothetical protein